MALGCFTILVYSRIDNANKAHYGKGILTFWVDSQINRPSTWRSTRSHSTRAPGSSAGWAGSSSRATFHRRTSKTSGSPDASDSILDRGCSTVCRDTRERGRVPGSERASEQESVPERRVEALLVGSGRLVQRLEGKLLH